MNTNTLPKEKIAIILEPHAQHLLAMKARGKSLSEMLYWLRSNHGWVLNPAQLEKFLKQLESKTPPQAETAATKAQEVLEYQQLMSSAPSTPSSTHCKIPPLASGSASAARTLATLMDKFEQVLSRVMGNSDDQPETLKVIDKMMHTVISYEQGKERLEQGARTLKIKEASQQRKAGKPTTNINNAVGDDVRRLIIPQKTHDKNGQITPDNPKTCPVEMLAPGFEESLIPVKDPEHQQDTAAVAGEIPGRGSADSH